MDDKDDMRLLFQVLSSQIQFSKTQQWTMAYYSLLFIAGLLAASNIIYESHFDHDFFGRFILFVFAAAVIPVAVLCHQLMRKHGETIRTALRSL